jgi:hypothetical protein
MFKRYCIVGTLFTVVLGLGSVGYGADEKAAGRPAELSALERMAGVWDVVVESSGGNGPDGKPMVQKGRALEIMQWALDKSFLAGHSTGEAGRPMSLWMWGFDTNTKTYRLWWFGVGGQVTEWAGAYNADTQEFTMRTEAGGGYLSQAVIKFENDNTRTQTVTVRDPQGNVTQKITAKMTRRK